MRKDDIKIQSLFFTTCVGPAAVSAVCIVTYVCIPYSAAVGASLVYLINRCSTATAVDRCKYIHEYVPGMDACIYTYTSIISWCRLTYKRTEVWLHNGQRRVIATGTGVVVPLLIVVRTNQQTDASCGQKVDSLYFCFRLHLFAGTNCFSSAGGYVHIFCTAEQYYMRVNCARVYISKCCIIRYLFLLPAVRVRVSSGRDEWFVEVACARLQALRVV